MSTDPTNVPPPPAGQAVRPSWPARNWKYVAAAMALVGWAVAAYEAVRRGEPIPAPPVIDLVQPLAAAGDPTPIDYEGLPYHGDRHAGHDHDDHPQNLQLAGAVRWPTDRITYSVDYASARGLNPPLAEDAIRAAFRQAAGWWTDHLQLELTEVPHGSAGAMIPVRFERIDGPTGVLAEAYLANGTLQPKPMRVDSSERWTAGPPAPNLLSLPTVVCHELGHSLGLGHDAQNAPAVMRPSYTAAIPREQERDVARMVQLGYRRRAKVPAPADVLSFPVQVKTDDVIQALTKAGYEVKKP